MSRARPYCTLTLLMCISVSTVDAQSAASDVRQLMETAKRSEHGVGATQDLDRALELYCAASALGEREAIYHLGWLYATGRLGKVDEVLAAAWFQTAAESGHPHAREQLARLDAIDRPLDQAPECIPRRALTARVLEPRGASSKSPELLPAATVRALNRGDIAALVRRLAPEYRLDPELVLALIEVESNFNPSARSPKNAQGLMQLIPETAARFKVNDVWEPVSNLRGGMAYLSWLIDHFNGDLSLALAGYNAGENAVERHGGIPPYPETERYVARVLGALERKNASATLGQSPRLIEIGGVGPSLDNL